MNHHCFANEVLHFVALQVTDHVPGSCFGKLTVLLHELLNIVFSKGGLAKLLQGLNIPHRFLLTDGDEPDVLRVSARLPAGLCDLILHCLIVIL